VLESILSRNGYAVLAASNGSEALELASRHRGSIDLLPTDIVMPHVSRQHLARQVGGERRIPVVYMSGYNEGAVVHHARLEFGAVMLAKPITPDALLRKIREVLSPKAAARAARAG
jgi:two-component system, cell cycle sensor histidine kinase and response regulator CckA